MKTPDEILTILEKAVEQGIIDECGVREGVPYYYGTFTSPTMQRRRLLERQ